MKRSIINNILILGLMALIGILNSCGSGDDNSEPWFTITDYSEVYPGQPALISGTAKLMEDCIESDFAVDIFNTTNGFNGGITTKRPVGHSETQVKDPWCLIFFGYAPWLCFGETEWIYDFHVWEAEVLLDNGENHITIEAWDNPCGNRYAEKSIVISHPNHAPIFNSMVSSVNDTQISIDIEVDTGSLPTSVWFEWGEDPSLDAFTSTGIYTLDPAPGFQSTSHTIGGLIPAHTYYYRAVALNSLGRIESSIETAALVAGPGDAIGFVYVLEYFADNITPYYIHPVGTLSSLTTASLASGDSPSSASVDPSGRYFYVTNAFSDNITQYAISTDGTLSPLSPASVATGDLPCSIAVDPQGPYVYVTNQDSYNWTHYITQYSISSDGTLSPLSPSSVATSEYPQSIAVDPSGRYVYVANLLSENITQYAIDTDGTLSPLSQSSVATSVRPNFVSIHPSGQYVYVANMWSNNITQYAINTDGTLSPLSPFSVATSDSPNSIAVHPSGQYVYVTNIDSDNITQYYVGTDGTLSPLSPASVATGNAPQAIAVHPSGQYVYVTNFMSGNITQYAINTDGTLSPLSPASVTSSNAPYTIICTGL